MDFKRLKWKDTDKQEQIGTQAKDRVRCPAERTCFLMKRKNLQKKEETVTKVAVSFTVSLGDTCARFLPRGSAGGRGHGLNNIMVHVWRLHRLTDCGVV